jgi:hypothetical protein
VAYAKLAIVLSGALAVAVGAMALSKAPPRVVWGMRANANMTSTSGNFSACQAGETLPAHVTAIRMSMGAGIGPTVHVKAYAGGRILTQGSRSPTWTGRSVTVPVSPLSRAVSGVRLCVGVGPNSDPLYVYGVETSPALAAISSDGRPLPGRMGVEYLAAGRGSWWSRSLSVARHMGLGHPISGSWVALLVALLVAGVVALTIRLAWRELP